MPDPAAPLPDHRPVSFLLRRMHLRWADDRRPHAHGVFRRHYAIAGVKPGTGGHICPDSAKPFDDQSRERAELPASGRLGFLFPARIVFGSMLPVLGITVFFLRPDEPSRVAVPVLLAAVFALTSPWHASRAVAARRSIDRCRRAIPRRVTKLGTNEK